jgi:hypothetical protein
VIILESYTFISNEVNGNILWLVLPHVFLCDKVYSVELAAAVWTEWRELDLDEAHQVIVLALAAGDAGRNEAHIVPAHEAKGLRPALRSAQEPRGERPPTP